MPVITLVGLVLENQLGLQNPDTILSKPHVVRRGGKSLNPISIHTPREKIQIMIRFCPDW